MKKVIVSRESIDVLVSELTNKSLVGVWFTDTEQKSTLIKNKDGYVAIDKDLDISFCWSKPSIQEYVSEALKLKAKVFVFETHKEMFNWLIE
jgi:hypothetical protein